MQIRDPIINASLFSNFLSFKKVMQTMRHWWESRPCGFILRSTGTFPYKVWPSPSGVTCVLENIWKSQNLKKCLEKIRERKKWKGEKKKRKISNRRRRKHSRERVTTNYWMPALCKELFKCFFVRIPWGRPLMTLNGCENWGFEGWGFSQARKGQDQNLSPSL